MPILRDLLSGGDSKRGRLPRLHGSRTAAGVTVDAERSLQVSAVYGCVRLIAEAIATLPIHLYRRTGDGRRRVDDHPLSALLTDQPNSDIDAGEFIRAMVGWMLLRGNGLTYQEIGGDGRPQALWPIAPTSVQLGRTSRGRLSYKVTLSDAEYVPGFTPNKPRNVGQDRMLHFRAFGLGAWGLSPVALARQKIGTAFAAESYGAGFFARGANPGGVLATDGELTDEQYERLDRQWKEVHEGFAKSHAPAILEGGLSWENVGLPPAEAQYLETQKYTAETIAGHIFFVPPHLIGDVQRSTSWGTGIAEQGISFVRYSLMPWIVRLERVLNRLLPERDLYVKFSTAALERGDLKSRYEAYAIGKQWGWKNTNEIKALEDEEPIGPAGDVYLQPLNMVPAGTFDEPDDGPSTNGRWVPIGNGRVRGRAMTLRERHVDVHHLAMRRFFTDQAEQVIDEYDRGARDFDRDESDRLLGQLLATLGLSAASDAGQEVADKFEAKLDTAGFEGWMRKMGVTVARQINDATFAAVAAAGTVDDIRDVFSTAVRARAGQIAATRVAEAFGFGRSEGAKQSGARRKMWVVTSTNPRAEHGDLDGETVDLGDVFSNGARWPGDTANLDASEVAGCQCDMEITT